jgi:hypothetical protein
MREAWLPADVVAPLPPRRARAQAFRTEELAEQVPSVPLPAGREHSGDQGHRHRNGKDGDGKCNQHRRGGPDADECGPVGNSQTGCHWALP